VSSRTNELAESIVHRYLALWRDIRRARKVSHDTEQLHGRRLVALRHVARNGPCTVSQVSRYLYVSDATTSALLDHLSRDGYITRRRCETDNRRVYVEATDAGRQVLDVASTDPIDLMRDRLPTLPVEELEAIDAAMETLYRMTQVEATPSAQVETRM